MIGLNSERGEPFASEILLTFGSDATSMINMQTNARGDDVSAISADDPEAAAGRNRLP